MSTPFAHPVHRDPFTGKAALLAVVAVVVAPIWTVHYLPSTDGGAHVANADVLLQYFRPAGAAYRQYYELNHLPVPNWLGHAALAALMLVFSPPVAEKLFVTLYLLLLPLAFRYAVTGVRKSSAFLAFLAVPLSLNWITHQGFYSFCGSVVVFFFALGYWLRRRETMNARRAVVLGLLGLLLYFGHLSSIDLFAALLLLLVAWFTCALAWAKRGRESFSRASSLRHELANKDSRPLFFSRPDIATCVALAPAILLAVWFHLHGFVGKPGKMELAIFKTEYWKDLFGLSILVSYRAGPERLWARATAALVLLLIGGVLARKLARRSRWRWRDGLILLAVAIVGFYFTQGNKRAQQLFIPQRLVFYAYLTAILFLAAQSYRRWMRRSIAVVAAVLAIGLTAAHWPAFKAYDAQLLEFIETADRMEPHSTFLSLILAQRGDPPVSDPDGLRITPFFSAQGYAATDRRAIDLRNYEARLDYFPVRYRSAVDPFRHLAVVDKKGNGLDEIPQRVDLAGYERRTPGRIDYVIVWGAGMAPKNDPVVDDTYRQLREGFDLIYESSHAQLWRHRVASPP